MSHLPNDTPDSENADRAPSPQNPDPVGVGQWHAAHGDEITAAAGWNDDPSADTLLAAPPSTVSDDDLSAALSAPPPTPRSMRLTRVLTGALILVVGFVGGVVVTQNSGSAGSQNGPTGARAGMAAGALPSAMPSGMAGGGFGGGHDTSSSTTGEVTLVDGATIYLTGQDGTLVRVDLSDGTEIQTASPASAADIEEGDTVTVTGTTTDTGVSATTVEVSR